MIWQAAEMTSAHGKLDSWKNCGMIWQAAEITSAHGKFCSYL